jgi:hypothetical protein
VVPKGPLVESVPPQQGTHLVGPVYLLVGPGPGVTNEEQSILMGAGLFGTRCGLPKC